MEYIQICEEEPEPVDTYGVNEQLRRSELSKKLLACALEYSQRLLQRQRVFGDLGCGGILQGGHRASSRLVLLDGILSCRVDEGQEGTNILYRGRHSVGEGEFEEGKGGLEEGLSRTDSAGTLINSPRLKK